MKKVRSILSCLIAIVFALTATSCHARGDTKNVVKNDVEQGFHFEKKDGAYGFECVKADYYVFKDLPISYISHPNSKSVKLFDLVTNPSYSKKLNYRTCNRS